MTRRRADVVALAVLALAPLLAFAPAWWGDQLLGPGDGAAFHYPLRVAVWKAWGSGTLPSWNPDIFLGTPLLASARAGALFPPTIALSLLLDPFRAFQALVLFSLATAGPLLYVYLRRLGAHPLGGLVAGLGWSLGPYFVGHLGDTAAITAAPVLPLLMLAAEAHVRRRGVDRAAGLALTIGLLLLTGSPEASRAGLTLVAGRLLVAYLPRASPRVPPLGWTLAALAAGLVLAAPQLVPGLDAARDAGRSVTGLAGAATPGPPGLTGLALRYLPSSPAPALALAALPLFAEALAVRVLGAGLALSLLFQWGRGPLAAPGALPLVFDLALNVLAGLSLSAQWTARHEPRGGRLRALYLAGLLLSAVALSLGATAGGPLPQTLAGSVGLLAVSQILYFAQARATDRVKSTAWLLPLVASFVLHPHGRGVLHSMPTRDDLYGTTPTGEAVERVLESRRTERMLTIVDRWPDAERDLAWGNLASLVGRRSANGYDPAVSLRTRTVLGGMGPGGTLPAAFLRSDPRRLTALGIGFVQVPATVLASSLPERIDTVVGRDARLFPFPMVPASELRLLTSLADAVEVPEGTAVAEVEVRLVTGRSFAFPLRAGIETAEWAAQRPDVRGRLRHTAPPPAQTWTEPDGTTGNRYAARLALPGRYWIDAVRVRRLDRRGVLTLFELSAVDGATGRTASASAAAAFLSDTTVLRERLSTPGLRLFDVPRSLGEAWVAAQPHLLNEDRDVAAVLQSPTRRGFDLAQGVLVTEGWEPPSGSRAGHAELQRPAPNHLEVRAEGPGLLVVAEGWDPGWRAEVDGRFAPVRRVDLALMAVELPAGAHRVSFRHRPRGFVAATVAAGLVLGGLLAAVVASGRAFP